MDTFYKKSVNKLQNVVIKENASNLVGACKLYSALFNNATDLKSICKALELPFECAVKVASLGKDKKQLVAICSQMLPKVDNTFIRLSLYSKMYKDKKQNENKCIEAKNNDWLSENAVVGSEYKPFGFASSEKMESNKSLKWITKENEDYKSVYVATPIKSYTIRLVAKCVAEYLSHESNDQ